MQARNTKGFTLIEVLVAIAVITLIVVGANNIQIKSISDAQKKDSFVYRIINSYELIRNNALIGKGIGNSLEVPESWQMHVSENGFYVEYNIAGTWTRYNEISSQLQPGEYIESVSCIGIHTSDTNISGTGTVIISGQDIDLSGECSTDNHNTLEIVAGFNGFTESIHLNTLSGLAEVQ